MSSYCKNRIAPLPSITCPTKFVHDNYLQRQARSLFLRHAGQESSRLSRTTIFSHSSFLGCCFKLDTDDSNLLLLRSTETYIYVLSIDIYPEENVRCESCHKPVLEREWRLLTHCHSCEQRFGSGHAELLHHAARPCSMGSHWTSSPCAMYCPPNLPTQNTQQTSSHQ